MIDASFQSPTENFSIKEASYLPIQDNYLKDERSFYIHQNEHLLQQKFIN